MNAETIKLLLQLVSVAAQLAPTVIQQIEGIRQQDGKSAEQIFEDASVRIDANNAAALGILANLMITPDSEQAT